MPASRPQRPKRTDTRMRVAFNADERALLSKAAGPDGLKQAEYVRATVLKALGSVRPMGPIAEKGKGQRSAKVRAYFSPTEEARIRELASAHGIPHAAFIRHVVLTSAGQLPKPAKKKTKDRDQLLHTLSVLAVQVKKLGTNVNQLAHQANAGMVPVTRKETEYVLNALQLLTSKATAAVESVLI